ncbi:MAG: rhodanese-like domain-containing protein [Burkholderiaceae bacterium]
MFGSRRFVLSGCIFFGDKRVNATGIQAQQLHDALVAQQQVVVIDPREEGDYSLAPHILQAVNLPLSHAELRAFPLLPKYGVWIVVASNDPALDRRMLDALVSLGYKNVTLLEGGIAAWEAAGYPLYTGFNTYSKAFGEFVEHEMATPAIEADELFAKLAAKEKVVVLDSRTPEEHRRGTIPTSISVPGAELGLRLSMLVPDEDTLVVVNCAGRTRSIMGAQSLINLGVKNPVRALRNGTMGWKLAGYAIQENSDAVMPPLSMPALQAAIEKARMLLSRYAVPLLRWEACRRLKRQDNDVLCYVLDVRTREEYEEGHPCGSVHAPGGQLLQATDRFVASLSADIVLYDACLLRAATTASWLKQMGAPRVFVLAHDDPDIELEYGMPLCDLGSILNTGTIPRLSPLELQMSIDQYMIVDLGWKRLFLRAHVPTAIWTVRSQLGSVLAALSSDPRPLVLAGSQDLSLLAYAQAAASWPHGCFVLEGGNEAWIAAGLPTEPGEGRVLCYAEDEFIKPLEARNQRDAMTNYLSWEVGLIDRVRTDSTVHFRVF